MNEKYEWETSAMWSESRDRSSHRWGPPIRPYRKSGSRSGSLHVIHHCCKWETAPICPITVLAGNEWVDQNNAEMEMIESLGKILAKSFRSQR